MTQFVEQKISIKTTVLAGETGIAEIPIPSTVITNLMGYGYTYIASCVYKLSTGNTSFPARQDQEGSISQPVIYGTPYPIKSGDSLKLQITNNTGSTRTYYSVFLLQTSDLLDIVSVGTELLFNTGLESNQNLFTDATVSELSVTNIVGFIQNALDGNTATSYRYKGVVELDLGKEYDLKFLSYAIKFETYDSSAYFIVYNSDKSQNEIIKQLQGTIKNANYSDIMTPSIPVRYLRFHTTTNSYITMYYFRAIKK